MTEEEMRFTLVRELLARGSTKEDAIKTTREVVSFVLSSKEPQVGTKAYDRGVSEGRRQALRDNDTAATVKVAE